MIEFQPGDIVIMSCDHEMQEQARVINKTVHGDYWVKIKRTGRECTAPTPTLELIISKAERDELIKIAKRVIARAKRHDIDLELKDFKIIEGDIYLDGMDPDEWLDAMTMN